jgi:uncharacterized protein (DUF169 family)
MKFSPCDFSIFERFNFERKPVGIKFLLNKPPDMERTEKNMPICRLLVEAQNSPPFYAGKNNFVCVDRLVLGMEDPTPTMESGQIGAKEKIYQEARANSRIYQHIQKIPKDTVRYVAFGTVEKIPFTPDLIIFIATTSQAEILFRALSFSTGKPLTSKFTPVLMCAWLFAYPFLTGEMNYTTSGIGYGMRTQKILPEGLSLVSIPYDLIPILVDNLQKMEWVLPITLLDTRERNEYSTRVMDEIKREYLNG